MKLAVISDLHLGPGDLSDRFGHDDRRFLRFLRFLEDNFERVVLLGDIWETLTPRYGLDPTRALRAAREAHPAIADRLSRPRYLYVHGNHDLVASVADGAPGELVLDADGTRLLFTHGHHYDVLQRRARWLSEVAVWFGAWLLRLGMSPLYRLAHDLDSARIRGVADPGRCTFQRWAVDLATSRDADVVITGHTHVPIRAQHGSRLFLNSGSCSEGNTSFLALDTRAGVYGVHGRW
jgi:predicted phosphodiesterase